MSLIRVLLCGFAGVDLVFMSARMMMLLHMKCKDLMLVDERDLEKILKEEWLTYSAITSTAKKDGLSKGYEGEVVRFFSGSIRMAKFIPAWTEVLCPGKGQSVSKNLLDKFTKLSKTKKFTELSKTKK